MFLSKFSYMFIVSYNLQSMNIQCKVNSSIFYRLYSISGLDSDGPRVDFTGGRFFLVVRHEVRYPVKLVPFKFLFNIFIGSNFIVFALY